MAGNGTSFRDKLLPALDAIRAIPYALGLRLFTVTVYTRTWSGNAVGSGTPVTTTSTLKLGAGSAQATVRQLSEREIIASAGQYTDQDYWIGPITPPYAGGSQDNDQISIFDPNPLLPTELWFNVVGPGHAAPGIWCKKVTQDVSKPFRYMLLVRNTGETPGFT